MRTPVFVVGLGQLGVAFSEGFLKLGHTVVPLLRGDNLADAVSQYGAPELVLLAVGEDDLKPILEELPEALRGSLVLLQNELRPASWQERLGECEPTLVVVWFEKKPGKAAQVVLPSVVFGPKQELLLAALEKMGLPARKVADASELSHELALKNLYILALNLTGLVTQGTARELLERHFSVFSKIRDELLDLEQAALKSASVREYARTSLSRDRLIVELKDAILADPDHGCRGRSAPRRLERTLTLGSELQIAMPTISALSSQIPR